MYVIVFYFYFILSFLKQTSSSLKWYPWFVNQQFRWREQIYTEKNILLSSYTKFRGQNFSTIDLIDITFVMLKSNFNSFWILISQQLIPPCMHSDVLCICNVHKDKSLRRKLSLKTKKKCELVRYSDAHKGNNHSSSIPNWFKKLRVQPKWH